MRDTRIRTLVKLWHALSVAMLPAFSPAVLHAQMLTEVLLRGATPIALTEPLTGDYDPLVVGSGGMGANGVTWMVPPNAVGPLTGVPVPTPAGFTYGYVTNVLESGMPQVVTGYGFGGANTAQPAIYAGPPAQPLTATLLPRYAAGTFSIADHAEGAGLYPDADVNGNSLVLVAGSQAVPTKRGYIIKGTYWTLGYNAQTGALAAPSAPTALPGLENGKPDPRSGSRVFGIAATPLSSDPPVVFGYTFNALGTRRLPVLWNLAGVGSATKPTPTPVELFTAATQSVVGLAAPYNNIMPNQVVDARVKAAAWCTSRAFCTGDSYNDLNLVGTLDYMPAGTKVIRHLGVVWIYTLTDGSVTALAAVAPTAGINGGALSQMNNEIELTGISSANTAVGEQTQRSPFANAGISAFTGFPTPTPTLIATMLAPGQTYGLVGPTAAINSFDQIVGGVKTHYHGNAAPVLLTPTGN